MGIAKEHLKGFKMAATRNIFRIVLKQNLKTFYGQAQILKRLAAFEFETARQTSFHD